MKWFDKTEIKDRETLTESEIAYLLQPSLSVCGFLNVIVRKQFDLFVARVLLFTSSMLGFVFLGTHVEVWATLFGLVLIASFALTFFSIRHGRRLAWNRSKWKSFTSFSKSERCWIVIAVITLIMTSLRDLHGLDQTPMPALIILTILVDIIAIITAFLVKAPKLLPCSEEVMPHALQNGEVEPSQSSRG